MQQRRTPPPHESLKLAIGFPPLITGGKHPSLAAHLDLDCSASSSRENPALMGH